MKSNLVFSPFAKPFVPLGIAHIKSYVETRSNHKVTCFDLNLLYYKAISKAVRINSPKVLFFPDDQRAGFVKTMDIFENRQDAIFNQKDFDRAAIFFTNCFKSFNRFFLKICKSAFRENKGFPFFIAEYTSLLLENEPDVIGFSLVYPEQFYVSLLMARLLKKNDPNIKIVFGGNTASRFFEECLSYPFIDYVVLNEGEKAFPLLLDAIERKTHPVKVPNLAYKTDSGIKTTDPELIKDLDSIPFPDFSDFNLENYFNPVPVIPVLGSRGCYWRKCAFCVHHKSYFLQYRKTSASRLVDELEYHVESGVTHFSFVDEMISAKRFEKIGKEILKRGLDITYYALAKPTGGFDIETLQTMHD